MDTATQFEQSLALPAAEETATRLVYARPASPPAAAAPKSVAAPLRAHVRLGCEFALALRGEARFITLAETFDLLPGRPLLIGRGGGDRQVACTS